MANHHNSDSSRGSLLFAQEPVSSAESHSERYENWWGSMLALSSTRSADSARSISWLYRLASSWGSWSTTWRKKCTERCTYAAKNSWDSWGSDNCLVWRPDSRVERLIYWAMDTLTSCWHRSEEYSIYGRWPRSIVNQKSNIKRIILFIREISEKFWLILQIERIKDENQIVLASIWNIWDIIDRYY